MTWLCGAVYALPRSSPGTGLMAMLHLPPTSGIQSSEGSLLGCFPNLPEVFLESKKKDSSDRKYG